MSVSVAWIVLYHTNSSNYSFKRRNNKKSNNKQTDKKRRKTKKGDQKMIKTKVKKEQTNDK